MSDIQWKLKGICHKLGDDVRHNDGLIPGQMASDRIFDPQLLAPRVLEELRPEFARTARPGDLVVAGKNFGKGKAKIQGYIGLRALGVGVLCESMPFLSYRGAVSAGLLFLTDCSGITGIVDDGDATEMDFLSGRFVNLSTGATAQYEPLPDVLREIIAMGGSNGVLRQWWQQRQAERSTSPQGTAMA
jgi:3-isopropylmalate/(R)-2-methylmalate dehydratase small subunit